MTTPSGWDGILPQDEPLLWQGRPAPRFHPARAQIGTGLLVTGLLALLFAAFALLWRVLASLAGGFFRMSGVLHVGAGLAIILSAPVGGTCLRRRVWLTLAHQRAASATSLPFRGRSLQDAALGPDTQGTAQKGALSSIRFARHSGPVTSARFRSRRSVRRSCISPTGFDRRPDGRPVLSLIRQAQRAVLPDPDQRPPA